MASENTFHEVDPRGDLVLIIRNPGQAFAEYDENTKYPPKPKIVDDKLKDDDVKEAAENQQEASDDEVLVNTELESDREILVEIGKDSPPRPSASNLSLPNLTKPISTLTFEEEGVKWRVSSNHLILASPYFKAMFTGRWAEAQALGADVCIPLTMEDWDAEAFSILMNIIHGFTRKVPRSITLNMLTKIAVLVDYYGCHEIVEIWSDMWVDQLNRERKSVLNKDGLSWILIAKVFTNETIFASMTAAAIFESSGPIETLGLPISLAVVDMIEEIRQQHIAKIIKAYYRILEKLSKGKDTCSYECSSILLGALVKHLASHSLFMPKPTAPYTGLRFDELSESSRKIHSPAWRLNKQCDWNRKCEEPQHGCTLEKLLSSELGNMSVNGLNIFYFVQSKVKV